MLQKTLLVILSLLLLSSCSAFRTPPPEIITQTEYVERTIEIQERPKAVNMAEIEWYVITQENLEEVIKKIESENGQLAIMALSVRGYENLSLNIADLRRYILQQKELIIYYEKLAVPSENNEETEK